MMNDSNRMLLQRLMAAGAMEESQVRRLARKLTGEGAHPTASALLDELTKSDVDAMVNTIAASVRPFALDVRRSMYDDGKMYIAVVNTSNDALTQLSSSFKPWEIVFFRKAIELIADSPGGAVHEADVINLRENTSISDVHELVRKLSSDKWLAGDASAGLTLGPRTFLELAALLRALDVKQCAICSYELLQGVACRNTSDCPVMLHTSCLDRFEERGLPYRCNKCKQPVR